MLIGISGKLHSGKDTLCNLILKYFGKEKCIHLKFADSLKKVCSIILHSNIEDQYSYQGKEKITPLEITNGRLQQLIGTNLRETIHPDIWIFSVIQEYKNNSDKICIISDCRFQNEAKSIKENGGILIRILREDEMGEIEEIGIRDKNHISETDLDNYNNFDLIIENNSTLENLRKTIFTFLESRYKYLKK